MYKCEILADSLAPTGERLTTYKVTYPRIIHAEMCRHRILSRNSASSRAIPFSKMVKMIEENPFIPIAWQKSHSGMQGTEYFTDPDDINFEIDSHLSDRDEAVYRATKRHNRGVTKQLCNRYLEPFMWHTEIISGTHWDNFFELRCPKYEFNNDIYRSKADLEDVYGNKGWDNLQWLMINKSQAEIHIQAIAEMMWDAYNMSKPKELEDGEWHLPFGDRLNPYDLMALAHNNITKNKPEYAPNKDELQKAVTQIGLKIVVARTARISYETLGDNPKIDYEADIKLHDMLMKSKHWSPFEHCARVMDRQEYNYGYTKTDMDDEYLGWCRNFRGFIQYRHLID
jgi:hypothetical protein